VCALALRLALTLHFGNPEKPAMYEMGVIASNMLHGHGYAMHWLTYIPIEPVRKAMVLSHTPPPYETAWQPPLQTYIVYGAFYVFGETPLAASMLMLLNVLWSSAIPLVVYWVTLLLLERSGAVATSIRPLERFAKGGTGDLSREPLLSTGFAVLKPLIPRSPFSKALKGANELHGESDDRAARMSAIAAALFLPAAYSVVTYSGSSLYQLVFLLFFWMLLLALRRGQPSYLLAAGVFAGIQILLRSEFLIFGILLLLGTGAIAGIQAKNRRFFIHSGVACLLAMLVITPWMLRNYAVFGKIVPIVSRPWFEIWRGNNPYATGCEWKEDRSEICSALADTTYNDLTRELDSYAYDNTFETRANALHQREALRFMRENPARTLQLAGKKFVFFWVHDLYNPQSQNLPYIAFMVTYSFLIWCGFVALWKERPHSAMDGALVLYAAYLLCYTAIFMLTFVLPRYRIYVYSGALPLTGLGLVWVWERFKKFQQPG
jgi:hypothetical protein